MIERVYQLTCDHCGEWHLLDWRVWNKKRAMAVARANGWSINTNTKKAKCPKCKAN